jgi:ribonuclease J
MSFNFSAHKDKLFFVPLGGANEIGMNLNAYHLDGKWLLVDLGIGFVDEHFPGIEIMVPDIDFLIERKQDILGLVVTHAHEDHLGAVPYLWDELQCPIYATPFTASVLKIKLRSNSMFAGNIPVNQVNIGSQIEIGSFKLDLIPLTHSIPEMQAIAIKTRLGTIVHTGDWKLDSNPLVGELSDEAALKQYGDEGVLAMVCDSTNVFVEGESGSESTVRENLTREIKKQDGMVFVTCFASNIARMESVLYAAKDAGRYVVLAGTSLWRMVEAAKESGYLQDAPELIAEKDINNLNRSQVLVLCTGCQGEPRAALPKIIAGTHPSIRISSKDTVFFSSRVIPGNETKVRWITNQLVRLGAKIVTDNDSDIHVSGHPARAELKRMYELVRPKIAVPVHGEAQHISEHAKYARSLGITESVEPFNGCVIQFSENDANIVGQVQSGYFGLDGTTLIPLESPIIKARRSLKESGNLLVSLVINKDGDLKSSIEVSAPGCMDPMEDESLRALLIEDVTDVCEHFAGKLRIRDLKDKIRNRLRKHLQEELGKRPLIEIHIHQL